MELPTIHTSWYVVGILTLALLLTGIGWNGTNKILNKERAEHRQVVQTFRDSQEMANKAAETKRKELQKKGEENAKQADANYDTIIGEYESNLMRLKTNQSDLIRSYRNQLQAAKGSNGPGGSTDVLEGRTGEIIITLADGRVCAINTARLQAVREWALNPPE